MPDLTPVSPRRRDVYFENFINTATESMERFEHGSDDIGLSIFQSAKHGAAVDADAAPVQEIAVPVAAQARLLAKVFVHLTEAPGQASQRVVRTAFAAALKRCDLLGALPVQVTCVGVAAAKDSLFAPLTLSDLRKRLQPVRGRVGARVRVRARLRVTVKVTHDCLLGRCHSQAVSVANQLFRWLHTLGRQGNPQKVVVASTHNYKEAPCLSPCFFLYIYLCCLPE